MGLTLGGFHHAALTVTDLARARKFYTEVLGFQVLMEIGPERTLLANGPVVLAINLPADKSSAPPSNDRFDENRAGLDHLSFSVGSRADLEAAVKLFDQHNVPHGNISDLGEYGLPIYVLAFRDADNIQLELTAPHG